MDRRLLGRWARRLMVRFWQPGEERPHVGHTVNLSQGGMYVGTDRPLSSGSRVRVEVLDPEKGFVVEGTVAHSHRVAPELRKIRESGMGVRFLGPQELIEPLRGPELQAAAKAGESTRPAAPEAAPTSFAIRYESPAQFLTALSRDMAHGGLFVPTRNPAPLDQVVHLRMYLPGAGDAPVPIRARVVQRFDPAEHRGATDSKQAAGMAVEFLDRDGTLSRLRRVADGLGWNSDRR